MNKREGNFFSETFTFFRSPIQKIVVNVPLNIICRVMMTCIMSYGQDISIPVHTPEKSALYLQTVHDKNKPIEAKDPKPLQQLD